ncbi:MAG: hypothetical protein Q9214_002252, partial [Letrouitia sp. 1 TL-2023]
MGGLSMKCQRKALTLHVIVEWNYFLRQLADGVPRPPPPKTAYLPLEQPTPVPSEDGTIEFSVVSSAFLPISSSDGKSKHEMPAPPPPKTAYLPLEQPTPVPIEPTVAPPAPSAYLPLEQPSLAMPAPSNHHPVEGPALSAYLPVKPTQIFSTSPFDASEGAYLFVVPRPTGGASIAKGVDGAGLPVSKADSGHNSNIQIAGGNEPSRGGAGAVIPAAGVTRGAGENSVELGPNT